MDADTRLYRSEDHPGSWIVQSRRTGWMIFPDKPEGWIERRPATHIVPGRLREVVLPPFFNQHFIDALKITGILDQYCERCGKKAVRIPRNWWTRLWFTAKYRCIDCRYERAYLRRPALPSLHRACPRCGNRELERFPNRDRIDKTYLNPISMLQRLIGAPLWWCAWCRLQFYDYRPALPPPPAPADLATGADAPGGREE